MMTEREERILAIVFAPGTEIYPSKINRSPQRYVVVNGLTGLDACELSTESCFDALLEEEDTGKSSPRVEIGFDLTTGLPSMRVTNEQRIPPRASAISEVSKP